ncbi:MAG: hypothetical protein A2X34_09960 [Elusimicrobia bacterium GWC2_51_8]|nr:MAG: hypothetical protein A2X33_06930 [Elusimicrobia bacterium GWA2_51_34]OGR58224.1 MAG: hypothetical protein A2X34_09960 [Elusimicrobia bacterium GWC2_51_8]OGR88577.1 MAG: hypothetical protein A2021_09905 [Elusimicrobia bacterium GWF2_52_66]HAF95461.1 hypothetical protein [Elusimicrobiota bacterium]HCE98123.1 hypothetical protein [Elusimicrobiota bacterium]
MCAKEHPAVINALESSVECCVLRYGAVRFRCPECGKDLFSCKRRGLCPSCDAKRSAIITGAALEHLLRYCSRPALSVARLIYSVKANTVIYRTEPRAGQSELLTMTPIEFLRQLKKRAAR